MKTTNRVTIIGTVAENPEIQFGKSSGKPYCTLRVQTVEYNDSREIHEIMTFGEIAEMLVNAHAGDWVFVDARVASKTYERRDGATGTQTQIVAWNVYRLVGPSAARHVSPAPAPTAPDDDIPF